MSESQPQRVKLLNDKLIGSFVAASIKFLELITRPRIEFTERPLLRERRNLLSRLRSRSIQSKRKSYLSSTQTRFFVFILSKNPGTRRRRSSEDPRCETRRKRIRGATLHNFIVDKQTRRWAELGRLRWRHESTRVRFSSTFSDSPTSASFPLLVPPIGVSSRGEKPLTQVTRAVHLERERAGLLSLEPVGRREGAPWPWIQSARLLQFHRYYPLSFSFPPFDPRRVYRLVRRHVVPPEQIVLSRYFFLFSSSSSFARAHLWH